MIAVADLKAWLGIAAADTSKNDLLEALEARAVAYLEEQTERYFGPVESPVFSEILPGQGTRDLWLSELPAAVPASVSEAAYPGATSAAITGTAADGYVLRTRGSEAWLRRKGSYVWTKGYEYLVAYERGYAAGEEPGAIKQAVFDLVRIAYKQRDAAGAGAIVSETMGNYSYRLSDASASSDPQLRADAFSVAATIAHWRRPVLS